VMPLAAQRTRRRRHVGSNPARAACGGSARTRAAAQRAQRARWRRTERVSRRAGQAMRGQRQRRRREQRTPERQKSTKTGGARLAAAGRRQRGWRGAARAHPLRLRRAPARRASPAAAAARRATPARHAATRWPAAAARARRAPRAPSRWRASWLHRSRPRLAGSGSATRRRRWRRNAAVKKIRLLPCHVITFCRRARAPSRA
jgi:hypothetical protein